MTTDPLVDIEHIESLLEFLAVDKVRALFESGLRGSNPLILEMREAAAAGHADKLYRAGHTAKGMFGNLGMRRCESLSRSIESLAKEGRIAEASAITPALEATLEATAAVMMQWIDDKEAGRSP